MSRLHFILPVAATLALTAPIPHALALAQAGADSRVTVPTYTKQQQKATKLSPIVVYGHKIPFPLQLQMYKNALTRPWSSAWTDRNKLVCRWTVPLGTHLQYLRCQTNLEHQREARKTRLAFTTAESEYGGGSKGIYNALVNGAIPMELANSTIQHQISRSTMAPLLRKLPPADASYTLRVTDHGKPVLEYVIKNGELAHIYHYVYKKAQKPVKH